MGNFQKIPPEHFSQYLVHVSILVSILDSIENSTLIEWNNLTQGCQAFSLCFARLDVKDEVGNLVQQPNLLAQRDADFQLEAPLVDGRQDSVRFQSFNQSNIPPYEFYINYTTSGPGFYNLYIRFNGHKPPAYPLQILSYSTNFNSNFSDIVNIPALSPQVAGIPLVFRVLLKDGSGNQLSPSKYIFNCILTQDQDKSIEYPQIGATQVSFAEYEITIVAQIRGWYKLKVEIANSKTPSNYNKLKNSPYAIYWQSNLASSQTTTVFGPAIVQVYTGTIQTFSMQVRDQFQNNFDFDFHNKSYTQLYNLTLQGTWPDGSKENITSYQAAANASQGLFTFAFQVNSLYSDIQLYVQIYDQIFTHIPGSPFTLKLQSRKSQLLCERIDLLNAGYGLTPNSYITSIPNVVNAGQEFQVQIAGINKFLQPYLNPEDPTLEVFQLNFVQPNKCLCSPKHAKYCNQFSWSYEQCQLNKHCVWNHISNSSIGASLDSCQPCHSCDQWATPTVQTSDLVYFYIKSTILTQHQYKAQLNVFTQGYFRVMVYSNPDWTGFAETFTINDLNPLEFNSQQSKFFTRQRQQWSAAIVGRYRFNHTCSLLQQNKIPIQLTNGQIVTYTLQSNLFLQLKFDQQVVLTKDESDLQPKQFDVTLQSDAVVVFELLVSNNQITPQKSYGYVNMYEQTFNMPQRYIVPMNMFFLQTTLNTLQNSITVMPEAPSQSDFEISNCPSVWEVPYSPTLTFKVRDKFGNQRSLEQSQLILLVFVNQSDSWTILNTFQVTRQNPETLDYSFDITLTQAHMSYYLNATLDGLPISNFCGPVLLKNSKINPSNSQAVITQQQKFFGFDDCIFANEIIWIVLDMRDQYGNTIPMLDYGRYINLFTFQFSLNSVFTTQNNCDKYGEQVICQIKAQNAGLQSVSGWSDFSNVFQGYPKQTLVYPSLQKKLDATNQQDINLYFDGHNSAILTMKTIDYNGQLVSNLNQCSYYKHERLIYFIYVTRNGIKVQDFQLWLVHTNHQLQFTVKHQLTGKIQLQYEIIDGLLVDDGILFQYYLNDNFQGSPVTTLVVDQSLVIDQNRWSKVFQNWDRFSLRVMTYIKPRYDEIHYFSSSITNNFELWIDDQLVISDGQQSGQILLHSSSWAFVEMKWRATNHQMPQFLVQVQSSSQQLSTLNSQNFQVTVPNQAGDSIVVKNQVDWI